ncbi:TonB-dependent receptor plug domain-containing protein [Sandarakinorhabdus oryzae]|uniref:TonB-dependent receptor plug domain-containing protein n=1 Tax=Sandarakinorhabdus oryzae TaxID=2675220 RepID=UPI0012E2D91B|nr:TonB-dependent receptor [Sandarakinorhabdus oryzae]
MLAILLAAQLAATPTPVKPQADEIVLVEPLPPGTISVTASREPVQRILSGTANSFIDNVLIDRLNLSQVKDYLTLVPSVAVAQTGPMGAQTQVRIRGAEANHTMTFIDGIDMTDPASSGEFRYETLLTAGVESIEVLRGPQSALWGSEAIGGVINITTTNPLGSRQGLFGEAEGGSLGTARLGLGATVSNSSGAGLSVQGAWLSSRGYNIAPGPGDRDGYDNLTLHAKGGVAIASNLTATLVLRHVSSNSKFDDFDYDAGVPLDAPLSTRTRQWAARGQIDLFLADRRWTHSLSVTHSSAANSNRDGGAFVNRSNGAREQYRYQSSFRFDTGALEHRVTAAVEHQDERFASIDADPDAFSNQRRSRAQTSAVGEYRLELADRLAAGIAVRRDWNNRFADATTARANASLKLAADLRLHGSWGSGIADPTFYDLYGFFPGFFIGNPNLKPERSTGWDVGLRWGNLTRYIDVTWYRARLNNEIISTFDPETFLSGVANASGRSRRQGIEVEGQIAIGSGLSLRGSYAWLDASQQQVAGGALVREVRRPRHSGSISTVYNHEHFQLAASAAITGARGDTDFARFVPVTLPAYTLVTLSGAWHITDQIDLTARIENALDARQVDVFAYRGPGLTAHGGIRFRL